jgi:hypothetical protein
MDLQPLIGTWRIENIILYAICVTTACLIVRIVSALLKAIESSGGAGAIVNEFWKCFRGYGSKDPNNNDHWHPFILGLFELSAYPVLMKTENWSFIGAWLAFKTLAQWKRWEEKRTAFNRFLIGNALVLFLAFLWLIRYVIVVKP